MGDDELLDLLQVFAHRRRSGLRVAVGDGGVDLLVRGQGYLNPARRLQRRLP
ncbi:hypothetical protein IL992_29105 [Microbispora sp. NEAU-D428]|nr:hypothetical protein [Microbispora sitophila]MBE3013211.1 hypothetical protein [Microbispora sitophila]